MKQRNMSSKSALFAIGLAVCLVGSIGIKMAAAQRDQDNDDFDDSGFDDSGYNSPQNHDAEGSHQNQNYSPSSEEDLDDDDDTDESNNVLARAVVPGQQHRYATGESIVQKFYSPANSIVVPIDPTVVRQKRSAISAADGEHDIEDKSIGEEAMKPLVRKRRYAKKKKYYIGPVYTFVKTDKHAHYKWGVKHKVGKHYG